MSEVRDCNGAILNDGDSVTVTKDLKVKGANATIKRGEKFTNIRLTNDDTHIEVRNKKIKGLMLKTDFVKKA